MNHDADIAAIFYGF